MKFIKINIILIFIYNFNCHANEILYNPKELLVVVNYLNEDKVKLDNYFKDIFYFINEEFCIPINFKLKLNKLNSSSLRNLQFSHNLSSYNLNDRLNIFYGVSNISFSYSNIIFLCNPLNESTILHEIFHFLNLDDVSKNYNIMYFEEKEHKSVLSHSQISQVYKFLLLPEFILYGKDVKFFHSYSRYLAYLENTSILYYADIAKLKLNNPPKESFLKKRYRESMNIIINQNFDNIIIHSQDIPNKFTNFLFTFSNDSINYNSYITIRENELRNIENEKNNLINYCKKNNCDPIIITQIRKEQFYRTLLGQFEEEYRSYIPANKILFSSLFRDSINIQFSEQELIYFNKFR